MEKPNQTDKVRILTTLNDQDHIQVLPVTDQCAPTPTFFETGFDIEMLELQEVTVGSEDSEEEKLEVGQFQEVEEKEEEEAETIETALVLQEIRGETIFIREVQEEYESRERKQEDVEGEEVEEYVYVWVKEKERNDDLNHGEEWAGQNIWWQGEKDKEDVFWLREVEEQLEGFYCEAREKAKRGVLKDRERTQREDKEIIARKSLKRQRKKAKKKRRVNKKKELFEDEKQNDEEDENGEINGCAAVQNKRCDTDEEQPQQDKLDEKDTTKKVATEENKKEQNADHNTTCEIDLCEEKTQFNLNEKNNNKKANKENIREEEREEEEEVGKNDTGRNDKSYPEKEDGKNDSGEERGDSLLEDSTSEEEVNWESEHVKETDEGGRLEEDGRPREEEVEDEEEGGWSRYGELRDYNPQDGEWPLEDLDGQDEEDDEAFYHPRLGWLGGDRVRGKGSLQTFGQLRGIRAEQYVREVTCAPPGLRVVLFLYRNGIPMCHLLENHLSRLAPKFPETKFLRIPARECVPNYPDSHLPTVFVYNTGRIVASLIGEWQCGGKNVLEEELKWTLATSGAFVIDSYADLYQDGTPSTPSLSTDDYSDCSEQSDGDHSDSDCGREDSERNESYYSCSNCSCSNSGDSDSYQHNHRSIIDTSDASDNSDRNQGDQLEDHSDHCQTN